MCNCLYMTQEELKKSRESTLKLQEAFASQKRKYEESKGYDGNSKTDDDPMYNMMRYMEESLSYVYKRMYAMEDDMWDYRAKHQKNHLPPMTPSAMAKMLEMCGMQGDYNIEKPTIYMSSASTNRKGETVIESNWTAKKG